MSRDTDVGLSPALQWRSVCGSLMLGACAVVLSAAVVRADDWSDCNSTEADKILAGCGAVITQATRPQPDIVKAYVNRAGAHARRGNADQSFADADSALGLDTQAVGALLHRGAANRQKGRSDAALADFERAIEIDPNNAHALALRGNLRVTRREWTQALADFDQSLALRPDFTSAYVARGHVYLELGALDKAIADFDRAIGINANVSNAFYYRGQSYRRKGDLDRAISDLSRAIALDPRNPVSYLSRGDIYSSKSDFGRAIADFDRALAIAPDNKTAQDRRQVALAAQAETARTGAAPAKPGTAPTPVQTMPVNGSVEKLTVDATQLAAQRKYDDALALLDRALALDSKSVAALKMRVSIRLQRHQRPQAIADLETWVRMGAPDPRAENTVASVQAKSAIDWNKAREPRRRDDRPR